MQKNKKAMARNLVIPLFIVFTIAGFMALANFAIADTECSGQDCPVNTTIILGNTAPTIPTVTSPGTITLNGGTTKVVYAQFVADDANGYADLNDSTAQVALSKSGEATRTSSSCAILSQSGSQTEYNCTITMQFYDSAGSDWMVNASVKDNAGDIATNSTETATVNALDYVTQDLATIGWSSVYVGQNDAEASAPLVLTNGGNQDYTNVSVKGYGATGAVYSDAITANKFSIDDQTGQTTGQTYMSNGVYVDVTQLTGLNAHGASVTENAYFYLDVPTGIRPDTYTSDSTWSVKVSA
jgi:hypothetical protein